MKNLATRNINDFIITESGNAFTTQRVAAKLCGVAQQAITQICLSKNLDVTQGLTPEILSLLVKHYAIESKAANDVARNSLAIMAEAGCKAWMYHEAGYEMKAEKPKSALKMLAELATHMADMEEMQEQTAYGLKYLTNAHQHTRDVIDKVNNRTETRMDSYESRKPYSFKQNETCISHFARYSNLSKAILIRAAKEYGVAFVPTDSYKDNFPIVTNVYLRSDLASAERKWMSDSIQTSINQWKHSSGKTFRPSI